MNANETRSLNSLQKRRAFSRELLQRARVFGVLTVVCAFAGCAETRPMVITEAIGPNPTIERARGTEGQLVVYTAFDGFDTSDPDHAKHTPFTIFTRTGKLLMTVRNRTGSFYQDPMPVALPPGNYRIEGQAANLGRVAIPVIIEANRTTLVFLDGTKRPTRSRASDPDLVSLPDGRPIGWRAHDRVSAR